MIEDQPSRMDAVLERIEGLVNRVLDLDTETRDALARDQGRTLGIDVRETPWEVYLTLLQDGVHLSTRAPATTDVTVRGTPAEFLAYLRHAAGPGSGVPGSIEIAGDVGLAQRIQGILANMELDWEEPVSQWLGDSLAHRLGNLVRSTSRYLADSGRTLQMDVSEYLRYEKMILPDRSEIEEFNAEVDTLRHDVERLKVRIKRLQKPGDS